MIMNYEEFLIENIIRGKFDKSINESYILERIDINNMLKSIKNIKNKNQAVINLINRFNNTTNRFIKKNIAVLLILIYFGHNIVTNSTVSHLFKPKIERAADDLSKKSMVSIKDLNELPGASYFIGKQFENIYFVNIRTVKTSNDGIDLIKDHEKLSLVAYKIGDGMITIGWGHANPIKSSPYKVGDRISEKKAEELFRQDLSRKEEGVRRILLEWEENGVDVKITQSMFDAMVSMAYNMGIGGLRRSDFIKYVKDQDYMTAADLIKTTRVSNKFPGLKIRRDQESELFLKDYDIT